MYKTIILSGNSTNGIVTLGALQYFYDIDAVDNVENYVGTSSGSIFGTLLSIGYTPLELVIKLCADKAYERISGFKISNILLMNKCLMNFQQIQDVVESMILDKISFIPTLGEIYTKFHKRLIFSTYNITKERREYITNENNPNLSCLDAIRMSSSFPFIFSPFEYNNCFYIDGGIVNNYPVDYAEEHLDGKNIGICITSPKTIPLDTTTCVDNIYFVKSLFFILLATIQEDIATRSKNTTNIMLTRQPSYFNFNLTRMDLLNMFDDGYTDCRKLVE